MSPAPPLLTNLSLSIATLPPSHFLGEPNIFGSFEFFLLQLLGITAKLQLWVLPAESPMSTISVANGTSKLKRVNFERVEVDIFDTTYFWRIGDLQM